MSANPARSATPDTSTPARKCAVGFEDAHRYASVEYGAIIAPDGTLLYWKKGTPNSVSFPPRQLALVAGITFTHNHPRRRSFSVDDVELAAEYQMNEMRVATADWRHFAYGLSRIDPAQVAPAYAAEEPYAQHYVLGKVMSGVTRLADMHIEVVHETWVRAARLLGFNYEREPS